MASNDDFQSLLSQLQDVEKSKDYLNVPNTFNQRFDSKLITIIENWNNNNVLSDEEKQFLNLYSNLELSFVEYCHLNSDTAENAQTMISKLPVFLFKTAKVGKLADAVASIHTQSLNNENDLIVGYIMRMIDARSLAYRLCFRDISMLPEALNENLKSCIMDREAKGYLYDIRSKNHRNEEVKINYRHKFFIGCCTFAVALYESNSCLKNDDRDTKYICLLAKYVRVLLSKEDFVKNESILYCIRGVLAILTNSVPREPWLTFMNDALTNENNDEAQEKNPLNLNLFSLIVNKLLASAILQQKAKQSDSNNEILLIDTALVFLNKWCDTQTDLEDDEVEENRNNNNNSSTSSSSDKPNQLLRCLCSDKDFQHILKIIIPYLEAKYDRLRLMALAILSLTMNAQDFEDLKKLKPNITKDLIELIFNFMNQAANRQNNKYKGVPFDRLLLYLLRFLRQDFVKEETLPYLSRMIDYAKSQNLYPLKILRKISTNPKLRDDLLKNANFKQFLEDDANTLYRNHPRMYKVVEDIRTNLVVPKPNISLPTTDDNKCQAFISYCHKDTDTCKSVEQKLKETRLFTNIWVDTHYMTDKLVDTVAGAIRQSKTVFALVSDNYCASDFCRHEWEYARSEKIKIYVIFVQKNFDRKAYDWVKFLTSVEKYYKFHDHTDVKQLIKNVTDFITKQVIPEPKTTIHILQREETQSPTSTSSSRPDILADSDEHFAKKPIAEWTFEDIRNWCINRHLEQWLEPLNNFDGQNLLVLRQDLTKDSNIPYFLKGTDLNAFDIARFKSELDKVLSDITTTPNRSTKSKVVGKRRISKSSVK